MKARITIIPRWLLWLSIALHVAALSALGAGRLAAVDRLQLDTSTLGGPGERDETLDGGIFITTDMQPEEQRT